MNDATRMNTNTNYMLCSVLGVRPSAAARTDATRTESRCAATSANTNTTVQVLLLILLLVLIPVLIQVLILILIPIFLVIPLLVLVVGRLANTPIEAVSKDAKPALVHQPRRPPQSSPELRPLGEDVLRFSSAFLYSATCFASTPFF